MSEHKWRRVHDTARASQPYPGEGEVFTSACEVCEMKRQEHYLPHGSFSVFQTEYEGKEIPEPTCSGISPPPREPKELLIVFGRALEDSCPHCEGTGWDRGWNCPRCRGRGVQLNLLGRRVNGMIRMHH